MIELSNASTIWVDLTNVLLGLATLICLGIVAYAIVKDVAIRIKQTSKVKAREQDDAHVLEVPELGLTMTDGGEKLYDDNERAFG